MKKIWVKKANSFREAEELDRNYYFSLSADQRLDIMQFLREMHYKMRQGKGEDRKGLRRVIRVIQ
jgi:hypothetical protein